MFSSKKRKQDIATQKGLGIAVQQPQPTQLLPTRETTTSTPASANALPIVSPLRMTFDFELPPSPALSTNVPFKSSIDSELRPQTSDGRTGSSNGRNGLNLTPPTLPPPRGSSSGKTMQSRPLGGVELEGSYPSVRAAHGRDITPAAPPIPLEPPNPRFDSDNVSTSSSKSRRKSRIKSFFGFDPPPDLAAISRPSSSSGTPRMPSIQQLPREPSPRPATSGSGGPRMESSLFPSKMESSLFPSRQDSPPSLPALETSTPVMTRAWLDARDKPYGPPSSSTKRPSVLQPAQSNPDLANQARSASMNFSSRSPLPTESPSLGKRPSPVSAATSPAGPMLQRPPSQVPRNNSASTARTKASSRSPAVEDSSPVLTVGTPYQETSPAFPPPQHVATRPKTAGTVTASLAGVNVPTHHTSSLPRSADGAKQSPDPQPKPMEKSERRKTRLLNPMALLSRRKSAQDEESLNAERAAQQAALAQQRTLATRGSITRLPDNFDPRIRGSGIHDFSAPRGPKRVYSSNDMDTGVSPQSSVNSYRRELQSANSAPYIPEVVQQEMEAGGERRPPRLTFVGQSFHTNRLPAAESGPTERRKTGFFQEHLDEDSNPAGGIRAERLENKDFLQRASFLSQQSSVGSSSESAVLPVFARRSQHWDSAQVQEMGWRPEDGGSKRVSSGVDQRDSGISSLSGVSPVTAGSGAAAGRHASYGARSSFSPISPTSDKRDVRSDIEGPGGVRPMSGASSDHERVKSSGGASLSEVLNARPVSNESSGPSAEAAGQGSPRPPISITIPMPPPSHSPPPPPPRGLSFGRASPMVISPGVDFPSEAPTPEPQIAEAVLHLQAPKSPPKLVEKRASAVGHSTKRDTGVPKHHVSNASRFSFQLGGSRAEEQALEDKARKLRANGEGVENTLGDDDEDDFFDEDAMDDLDEMEVQARSQDPMEPALEHAAPPSMPTVMHQLHQRSGSGATVATTTTSATRDRASVAQFMYRPATTTAKRPRASALELQIEEGDSGQSEEEEEETPYWMHEDFTGYSSEQSRQASVAEGAHDIVLPTASEGARSRGMSASSGLTLDTSVGTNGRNVLAAQVQQVVHQQALRQRPERDSSGSERNRILSGMNFTTTTLDSSGRITHHTPAMSSSTNGGSSSSEPRTISTGLGLSGFSDFRFSDSAPPSRPASSQVDTANKQNRRTNDSMTIPNDVDWFPESNNASPALKQKGRSSDGWEDRLNAMYGTAGRNMYARRGSSPLAAKPRVAADVDDDMYFDDGGFEHEVHGMQPQPTGEAVDESAFDDDSFLARNGNSGMGQTVQVAQPRLQINHQREMSGITVASLGSDGPYPSFAMPNPIKARQRDSRMLLEDLPLQTGPVDPKFIPHRNPSEDAKRLGLSSRAPPLPPQPGSQEALQNTQTKLQAYHAALADAANRAAAEGRFFRAPSNKSAEGTSLGVERTVSHEDRSPQPSMTSAYSRGENNGLQADHEVSKLEPTESQESTFSKMDMLGTSYSPPRLSFDFGFDSIQADGGADDDYDDFMNDDDIVAAANAEALASDDEGFYGQEFGFYAKARPNSGDLASVNGGYFGPDGDDGLNRNRSLKEPNLTPITERSEFSTRNSFISSFGPASAGPMSATTLGSGISPALARMPFLPLGEDEVASFDQLRKLRAHAFGGSNASLQSDGTRGSQSSLVQTGNGESPTLSVRNSAAPGHGYFPTGGAPMTFGYSTDSSGSSNAAPQLPQQQHFNPMFADSPHSAASSGHLPFATSENDVTPRRPLHSTTDAPVTARKASMASHSSSKIPGHSRTSSGADSVTYVKEQSPDGPPRWVLERRRTSEQGQLELVAREFVKGGWI